MLHCSISISTNEMYAFGVIQSHDILGHMVKCYYAIGSIRYWTYFMISRINTMKTFKLKSQTFELNFLEILKNGDRTL